MIVTFDLEGTLVDGELFPALGKRLGCSAELEDITEQAMNGSMDFTESLYRRIELIKGTSLDTVRSTSRDLPLMPGAEETIASVKRMGGVPCIITGGFDVLAHRVAYELGVEYVSCNSFNTTDGRVTGVWEPIVSGEAKAQKLLGLASWLGIVPYRCVAVGDGANDIDVMKAVGLSISYNGREKVREAASVNVETRDLRDILGYIEEHASLYECRHRGLLVH